MNEFSVVEDIVKDVLPQLYAAHVEHVNSVYFRRGSGLSEEALRQAYDATTQGTPLQDAILLIDTVNLYYYCRCGHEQVIRSSDLEGHRFICPKCGRVHEVDDAHELELLQVIAETD